MKKNILNTTLIIILFSLPYMLNASETKITGTIDYQGELSGKIIIATLTIPPDLNEPLKLDTLDTPGYYEITGLSAGTFFIGAYMDVNANGFPGMDEPVGLHPAPIPVDSAEQITNIDFVIKELPRGTGSISGTVSYTGVQTGEVHVYALGLSKTPFISDHFTWGETDGFSIDDLFAGEYLVVGFIDVDGNQMPDLTEPLGVVQPQIRLEDDEQVTEVTLTLFDTDSYHSSISGTAFYSGFSTGDIHVMAAGLSFTPINELIVEPSTGDFKLGNLASGDYYIFCYLDADSSGGFDLGEPFAETYLDEISIGWGQDTTGIELFLSDIGTGTIKGSITYEGTERGAILAAAAGLSATPLSISPVIAFGAGPYPYTVAGLAPGFYTVAGKIIDAANIPEELIDYLSFPFGYYLDDFIYIEKGNTVENINFTIEDTSNSTITGTIFPPEDATGEVFIFSLGLSLSPFRTSALSEAGPFEISDLGQGKYIIAAFMDVNGDSTYSLNEPVAFTEKLITVYSNSTTSDIDLYLTRESITDVPFETAGTYPKEFDLFPNYPNPFNPTTTIKYQVPKASFVTIKVYNVMGEEIATLLKEDVQAGAHQLVWETRNMNDSELSSGVYIYSMQAGDFRESRKMMLIR
jgi:uncharacterized protein (DUF2141 family)